MNCPDYGSSDYSNDCDDDFDWIVAEMTDEAELRDAVRTIVYDPIEPVLLWIARRVVKWFI